jgi:hypothetical protein
MCRNTREHLAWFSKTLTYYVLCASPLLFKINLQQNHVWSDQCDLKDSGAPIFAETKDELHNGHAWRTSLLLSKGTIQADYECAGEVNGYRTGDINTSLLALRLLSSYSPL